MAGHVDRHGIDNQGSNPALNRQHVALFKHEENSSFSVTKTKKKRVIALKLPDEFRMVLGGQPTPCFLPQNSRKCKFFCDVHSTSVFATSTQSSLQVQRASVARMTPMVNSSDFVILSFLFFFFFGFQPKATWAGDEKQEKKAHGLRAQ